MKNTELQDWRYGQECTQGDIAQMMGISKEAYRKIEAGTSQLRPVHVYALRWSMFTDWGWNREAITRNTKHLLENA